MISPSQRPLPDNTQHSQHTNIQALGGIRTHDRSRWAAVDLRLRPRGHWDRLLSELELSIRDVGAKALRQQNCHFAHIQLLSARRESSRSCSSTSSAKSLHQHLGQHCWWLFIGTLLASSRSQRGGGGEIKQHFWKITCLCFRKLSHVKNGAWSEVKWNEWWSWVKSVYYLWFIYIYIYICSCM